MKRTGKTIFDPPVHRKPPPAPVPPPYALALQLLHRGELERSRTILDGILRSHPGHADAWHLRGLIAIMGGDPQRGADYIGNAIALQPGNAVFHFNRGNAFKNLGQMQAAVESYDETLRLKPDHTAAYCNRGIALHALRRFEAALESYDRALGMDPRDADCHFNRGLTLHAMRQLDAAVASYERAVQLRPDFPEAYCKRGQALSDAKEWSSAAASFDRAIELRPDYAEAYWNRAHALVELRRFEAALADYDTAARLRTGLELRFGDLLHARSFFCDWSDYDLHLARVRSLIEQGAMVSSPFPVAAIFDSPALQSAVAEIWTAHHHPPASSLGPLPRRDLHAKKIRLGYYSEDFHEHATCHLVAGMLELHDKDRFELVAFSYGPDVNDGMRQRVLKSFDTFVDVRTLSDLDVTRRSRELGIDIAIDLKGYAPGGRVGIFSERCAPIQVNYLGFPGTMGVDYFDYIVADRTLIPEATRRHYAEKIVYLPDTYQPNDALRPLPMETPGRPALGLPASGFVFCCLNDCYKITPPIFDRWMRILNAVEGSVLWLYVDREEAARNLRKEAAKRGVDEGRLIFGKRVPVAEHLARFRAADLFLDTLPYNAHTTASEALWLGLPVLTCMGEAFAARVAASLLNAIHLPEMITTKLDDYESLAVALARDPARLQQVKDKLALNRLSAPLFDTRLYTRNLEAAFTEMVRRHQEGLPPDHIFIG